jgi:Flp pilus assembly protein TadD
MLLGVATRHVYSRTCARTSSSSDATATRAWTRTKSFVVLTSLVLVVVAVLCTYGRRTTQRHREWANGHLLWSSAYKVNPQSAHVLHNYALELSWKGQQKEAARSFKKALRLRPEDLSTRFALSLALRLNNKCPQAQKVAQKGLDIIRK